MPDPSKPRPGRLGQRLGIALLALFVSVPTAVWSLQIMREVWSPPLGPEPSSCAEGLLALLRAVETARAAAAETGPGERQSLGRFRSALAPAWASRPNLEHACQGQARELSYLRAIDGFRYAEEHAVRYEATALARARQRARELDRELARLAEEGPR